MDGGPAECVVGMNTKAKFAHVGMACELVIVHPVRLQSTKINSDDVWTSTYSSPLLSRAHICLDMGWSFRHSTLAKLGLSGDVDVVRVNVIASCPFTNGYR
jgi:hypothetical protein